MNHRVIKCEKCHKVFYDIGKNYCPFCKGSLYKKPNDNNSIKNEIPDFIKNIFGGRI